MSFILIYSDKAMKICGIILTRGNDTILHVLHSYQIFSFPPRTEDATEASDPLVKLNAVS